ncbi:MAG TPA: hypothetical protein DDY82_03570, partial [Clostridiales bacterium]|nr:hypothetical protein [Clostridiales bacterium]
MEFYTEKQRKIKVVANVDVLVAGSGPAGFGAAIAAGRMGMKTLIVEQGG